MNPEVYNFITSEETAFKSVRVPLTNSKDWNMAEHIERCYNVANAYYHSGQNDGNRRYDDIVTPILNVSFKSSSCTHIRLTPLTPQHPLKQPPPSNITEHHHSEPLTPSSPPTPPPLEVLHV